MGFQLLHKVGIINAYRHKTEGRRFLTRTGPQGTTNGVRTNLHILDAILTHGRLEVTIGELLKRSGKQDILDHE